MRQRSKFVVFLAIIGFLFTTVGCGAKGVREVPPEVTLADRAIQTVYMIKDAFIEDNLQNARDSISEELFNDLLETRKRYEKVELNFKTYWVEIQKQRTTIFIDWTAKWMDREGNNFELTGIGGFVMEGQPPKLVEIIRDNPFRSP